jgi:hypothetical protein
MSANILFISESLIKSRTGISDAIDGKQLKPHIKVAQDLYLQPALGSTLYLRLQSGIEADNLSNLEKSLLDNYITDCLLWYTMSLLPFGLGYQFFSKGILQKTSEESNAPSRADLELIGNEYKKTAEFYKQRLINYLRENYLLYSQYFNPASGLDVIFPELKAYTSPIYLGNVVDGVRVFSNNATTDGATTIYHTPAAGDNSFSVGGLTNKVVLIATRSGLVKGITNLPTANPMYLQIVNDVVTLSTGDVTQAAEIFTFTIR